jgi:hypothetical protein
MQRRSGPFPSSACKAAKSHEPPGNPAPTKATPKNPDFESFGTTTRPMLGKDAQAAPAHLKRRQTRIEPAETGSRIAISGSEYNTSLPQAFH